MDPEFKTERWGKYTVVSLVGIVRGNRSEVLMNYLSKVLEQNPAFLALEAQGLSAIDSFGIGAIAHALKRVRKTGGILAVVGPSPVLLEQLKILNLAGMLKMFPDRNAFQAQCA